MIQWGNGHLEGPLFFRFDFPGGKSIMRMIKIKFALKMFAYWLIVVGGIGFFTTTCLVSAVNDQFEKQRFDYIQKNGRLCDAVVEHVQSKLTRTRNEYTSGSRERRSYIINYELNVSEIKDVTGRVVVSESRGEGVAAGQKLKAYYLYENGELKHFLDIHKSDKDFGSVWFKIGIGVFGAFCFSIAVFCGYKLSVGAWKSDHVVNYFIRPI
ncbi:MAG: hypothetical protein CMJ19_07610 [Phycisphaeraceae bacterium]|nr:hypothetical protein [Phycisphaeraceae bacterium]